MTTFLMPGDRVIIDHTHPELPPSLRGRYRVEITVIDREPGYFDVWRVCQDYKTKSTFKAEGKFLLLLKTMDANNILKEML